MTMSEIGNDAGSAPAEAVAAVAETSERLARARAEIAKRVIGQPEVVDLSLMAVLCGGHGLLVGAPGLAKTRLVETIGSVLGLSAKRVQFTPDLMPADILGAEVLEETATGGRDFRFIDGPVFCQLLMADEINRASPRTQSALLQAMQEKHVTVAGQRRDLPKPFHVLATQNPIEQEGTYPLPEAQLDRFLFQIDVVYPDRDAEREIMLATTGADDAEAATVFDAAALMAAQGLLRRLPVGDTVTEAILTLVRACRPGEPEAHPRAAAALAWGPGPRAAQTLMLGCRARALLDGRYAPTLGDVAALAPAALKHRAALTFAARADGETLDSVLGVIIEESCGAPAGAAAA